LLLGLPQSRWVFTNADSDHAHRVLSILELESCFEGVIDVRAIRFACKPEQVAYKRALALAGNPLPKQCVLLDDNPDNLRVAHNMGFTTVLIGEAQIVDGLDGVNFSSPDLLKLTSVFPDLWDTGE
jgi:HAD superfamily hydrolase (TIGR01509 family)